MQPKWQPVGTIGDANPEENSGGTVYVDTTGVYPPEITWYDADEKLFYRIVLERCTYIGGVLSDNKFHPQLATWFTDYLDSGNASETWLDNICSEDAMRRAVAYWEVAEYYGWYEFDQYPFSLLC